MLRELDGDFLEQMRNWPGMGSSAHLPLEGIIQEEDTNPLQVLPAFLTLLLNLSLYRGQALPFSFFSLIVSTSFPVD